MKRIAIMFGLALLTPACSDDGDSLESLKDQACACKDMACVEKVSAKMEKFEEKFSKQEPSVAEAKLGEQIEGCMAAAMLGGKK